jgi:ParB family transcriptional regulator, chromosome partitioning protein
VSKNSKQGGLGRGLDALIPRVSATVVPQKLALNLLEANKSQPRTVFEDDALIELSKSIAEKGVLQPLLVRPKGKKYEIVAGERRFRAAKLAGLEEVPVIVRELDDRETLEIALIENLQREDLNPLEEARAYQGLLDLGSTQEELAKALGKGRSTITNGLRLLQMSRDGQKALEDQLISAGHARAILAMPSEQQDWALEQILTHDLTVRQAEELKLETEKNVSRETIAAKPRVHRQLELELSRLTGTKVKIVGQDRGKLELHYHNLEDLNRILEMIGYEA